MPKVESEINHLETHFKEQQNLMKGTGPTGVKSDQIRQPSTQERLRQSVHRPTGLGLTNIHQNGANVAGPITPHHVRFQGVSPSPYTPNTSFNNTTILNNTTINNISMASPFRASTATGLSSNMKYQHLINSANKSRNASFVRGASDHDSSKLNISDLGSPSRLGLGESGGFQPFAGSQSTPSKATNSMLDQTIPLNHEEEVQCMNVLTANDKVIADLKTKVMNISRKLKLLREYRDEQRKKAASNLGESPRL
jgi:hypothetical protein